MYSNEKHLKPELYPSCVPFSAPVKVKRNFQGVYFRHSAHQPECEHLSLCVSHVVDYLRVFSCLPLGAWWDRKLRR